jgi:hypothetical protein
VRSQFDAEQIAHLAIEVGEAGLGPAEDADLDVALSAEPLGENTQRDRLAVAGRAGDEKWRVPLGACSALSLAKAREAAAAVMGDVAKGRNPAAERKDAAAAERAKRARDRLTLRVLIEDWNRLHLAGRRASYAAEAVRALHCAFADVLDDAAEDLDRAASFHSR